MASLTCNIRAVMLNFSQLLGIDREIAMAKQKIVFTGGGSAGHVTPNLALIDRFQDLEWDIDYIGSENGIERDIIGSLDIPYHAISTGKLRRQITWKNLIMPFSVLKGIIQSFFLLRKIKPNIVFSKGGFVALPVVFAAWLNRIPVIIHEADITPGLANKLSAPFAQKICITNELAKKYYKKPDKLLVTGIPLRPALFKGNANTGRTLCGFTESKPIILVFGGSLGSHKLNSTIRAILPKLQDSFQVAHICGSGKTDSSLQQDGYHQFEYLNKEMPDILACADLVVSRAGANSIYELLSLHKPHILIPLPTTASRGDQIDNAKYYASKNLSTVIFEEDLSNEKLLNAIVASHNNSNDTILLMQNYALPNSVAIIEQCIETIKA